MTDPYKDPSIKVLQQDDVFATVELHLLIRKSADSPWDENVAVYQLKKVGASWRVDNAGDFISLSASATATADAAYVEPVVDFDIKRGGLAAVTMVSPNEGWAVGENGIILHYTGDRWTLSGVPGDSATYNGVLMVSPAEGFAFGAEKVSYYSKGQWQEVKSADSVAVASSKDIWHANSAGQLLHYSNGRWEQIAMPGDIRVTSVQMISATEGWAVGEKGSILHYSAGQWTAVPSPVNDVVLISVFMISAAEGWAVGTKGTVLHYTQNGWQKEELSINSSDLFQVFMVSGNEGWIVGRNESDPQNVMGILLHYHNGKWESQISPFALSGKELLGIYMLSQDEGWAVGFKPTADRGYQPLILHYRYGFWHDITGSLGALPTVGASSQQSPTPGSQSSAGVPPDLIGKWVTTGEGPRVSNSDCGMTPQDSYEFPGGSRIIANNQEFTYEMLDANRFVVHAGYLSQVFYFTLVDHDHLTLRLGANCQEFYFVRAP